MCITTKEALLEETYLLVTDLPNGNHLLIYQNEATTKEINAMILPIDTETLDESCLKEYPSGYLSEIYIGVNQYSRGGFDRVISTKCGSYDVHIVNRLTPSTFAEINRLGIEMKTELYDWYQEHYLNWSFVFCVFDEKDKSAQKHPIGIEYKPRNPEWLHFPLVDSHTGGVPHKEYIKPHQICICEDNYIIKYIDEDIEFRFNQDDYTDKDIEKNFESSLDEEFRFTYWSKDFSKWFYDVPINNIKIDNCDMFVRIGTVNLHDLKSNYDAGNLQFKLPH